MLAFQRLLEQVYDKNQYGQSKSNCAESLIRVLISLYLYAMPTNVVLYTNEYILLAINYDKTNKNKKINKITKNVYK